MVLTEARPAILRTPKFDLRRFLLAPLLTLIGFVLIAGGVKLVLLGGSLYYIFVGVAVIASAFFIWRRDPRAIWIYAALLVATLLWALWDGGLNVWSIQSRLIGPLVLGVWVCWPALRASPKIAASLALLLFIIAGVGLYAFSEGETFEGLPSRTTSQPLTAAATGTDWHHYGNNLGGTRFSAASQISPANVKSLKQAWTYHTGDLHIGLGFEATPLMVNDTLYLCTPRNIVIALDPDSGKAKWTFNPNSKLPPTGTCRGVSYYKVVDAVGVCAERIIFGTVDARLMAVDAQTGKPCPTFGKNGSVDLWEGMGPVRHGYYFITSAPTIVNGNVVLGGWVVDGQTVGEPSGVVRGFNAVTGEFAWAWDMDRPNNHGKPAAGQFYSSGTANSWAPMSGDEALGLVYVPTGNSTPDYWGAHRSPGSEKYSSSVVALDARTGQARWSFQAIHHDLWDYDVASQPTLIDLSIDGKIIPALVQPTKNGQVFLLDRRNGTALAPVKELAVPQGAAPGDFLSPTQPFSIGLPSFDDTRLSEGSMWGATPIDQLWCRIKFREARYDGPMTPPGVKPTITYPSFLGGIDWGGVSIDPERRLMVVNWSRMANYTRMVPRKEADAMGIRPSVDGKVVGKAVAQAGTPFALETGPFLSPLAMPCTQPPFGKIAVVNLDTRKLLWSRPLGKATDSGPLGVASHIPYPMGVPNTGGSLATRSGLVFIGATQEKAIRAFNSVTGEKLWEARLPAGGHATPMTFVSHKTGRQYVVISAGGNVTMRSGTGDSVVAFALPAVR
jgi:quinoprotein glucose dehydrogenase